LMSSPKLGVVGEKLLFPLVLLGLMLPMEAFIVPLYYDFLSYHLTDTYQGIILAHLGIDVSFGRYLVQINLLSAAAILVSLPVIVLSFVFQRQFIRGILSGAVKG
jgi:ABC-type glycerol-3-phosphate transport system permease component